MHNSFVFHKSVVGASHIRSEKPCQDFSVSYKSDNVTILVVSDGHGGNTYCRSDKGARIAANVCKEQLIKFAEFTPSNIFSEISFSITAKPQKNPFIDADGRRIRYEDLGENQQQYAKQAQNYIESENLFVEQQMYIKRLISEIYNDWRECIFQDQLTNPFTPKEFSVLNGNVIEKAYGCTLLAFMQTEHYWLAFQIGDGKIFICDKNLEWNTPVPEDCACFLNYTTSLCDNNPVVEFRYAFNGVEKNPIAVMLCSDGLDGSLRSDENLIDFYEQILNLYIDGDDIEKEISSYLPQLSEIGNKDDISLSGKIDLFCCESDKVQKIMQLKKDSRTIQNEHRIRKQEIEMISSRLEILRMKLKRQKDMRFDQQIALDTMRQKIKESETAMEEFDKTINTFRNEIEELEKLLHEKEYSFENWKFTSKNKMAEIEDKRNELTNKNTIQEIKLDYTNWLTQINN